MNSLTTGTESVWPSIPKLGQLVGNQTVGQRLGRRFYHLTPEISRLPTDIFRVIYGFLSAKDLAVLERVSKNQQRLVKEFGWDIYFKKRGFSCWPQATKLQWMRIPLLFGPKQLIVHVGLDRWMEMIRRNTLDAEVVKKDNTFITFKKMGNHTFAFWVINKCAFFAIRYLKTSNENQEQDIVVFCQKAKNARNWYTSSPYDSMGLSSLFNGSLDLFEPDDWRWGYFGRLIRGIECGTGPKGVIQDEKITLWKTPALINT